MPRDPRPFWIMQRSDDLSAIFVAEVKAYTRDDAMGAYARTRGPRCHLRDFYAVGRPRISPEIAHVLNLARRQGADIHHVPLVDGKGSQSRTVGRGLTIEACQRYGWLTPGAELTPAGRRAIAEYEEKQS